MKMKLINIQKDIVSQSEMLKKSKRDEVKSSKPIKQQLPAKIIKKDGETIGEQEKA